LCNRTHGQNTYPVLDSIQHYIYQQNEHSEEDLSQKFIALSNSIFNQYSTDQIDTISQIIQAQLDDVKQLKPKVILHQIRCAYLSNSSRLDQAEQCEAKVLEWARESRRNDIKLLALEDLNFIYSHQGRSDEQIDILHQAIDLSYDLNLPNDRIYYFAWLGEAYSYRAQYDSAYHYLDEGLALAITENDSALLANVYERHARVALDQGNYLQSLNYSQKALKIAQLKGMRIREETNLIYSAYNYFYLGDHESAIDYELKALALYENNEDANTASIYSRIGNIYNSLNDYDTALDYLTKAKKIYTETNYTIGIAKTDLNLTDTYLGMQEIQKARSAAQSALATFQSVEDKVNLSHAYRKLAKIELEIGENCSLKGINTFQYAKRAFDISESSEMLSRLSELEGYEDEALSYHKEYLSAYQSIYNQKNQGATTREQVRFNVQLTEEKRKAAVLKSELLKTRNDFLKWIVVGSIGFALLLGFLILRLFKTQKKLKSQNILINTQNKELSQHNDFKDRLFSIISHDLKTPFSAIQTIPNQLRKRLKSDDINGAHELINDFDNRSKSVNSLLQNLLQWSLAQMNRQVVRQQKIHVEDEILDALDLYESVAMEKRVEIETDLNTDHFAIGDSNGFQTICRNLIHNAIKFSSSEGKIEINTIAEEGFIKVSVRDYGQGMKPEAIQNAIKGEATSTRGTSGEKGTGLGMIVIQEIVKSNNGYFSLENMDQGLKASFKFPSYESASD